MKKKLLLLTDTIDPMVDGVSIFLRNIIPFLIERFEVTIIAPDLGPIGYDNVRLIQFPTIKLNFSNFSSYGIPKIKPGVIAREVKHCDVVLNQESLQPITSSFFAIRYARKYHKPFFTYIHAIDWESMPEYVIPDFYGLSKGIKKMGSLFLRMYGRRFLKKSDMVIIPFRSIGPILQKNRIQAQFKVAPVGTSEDFHPGKSKYEIPGRIVIGYVGRISTEKGLEVLLNVFQKLDKKYPDRLRLLIVGDGPLRPIFHDVKNVTITGFVSYKEVAEYLRAMHIFVLPSTSETSSLSTLEAMRSGCTCVTRDVGCIKDYLTTGKNGFFFTDEQNLLDILERISTDDAYREKIGKAAWESTMKYTWKNTVDCLEEIINNFSADSL
jgi:glycosyltransferase involved in cell wall biosynthesis